MLPKSTSGTPFREPHPESSSPGIRCIDGPHSITKITNGDGGDYFSWAYDNVDREAIELCKTGLVDIRGEATLIDQKRPS